MNCRKSASHPANWNVSELRTEDLRYEEIAMVLGLRSGTVGALLTRAHEKIRKALAEPGRRRENLGFLTPRRNDMHPNRSTLIAYSDGEVGQAASRRSPDIWRTAMPVPIGCAGCSASERSFRPPP